MAPSRGLNIFISTRLSLSRQCRSRPFGTSSTLQSGHNRWSKIKHDKGKNDAVKNRQRSAFAQEIATASKLFGPDPSLNSRLAEIIAKAKKEGFAKSSIEAAVARGQGRSATGASLESVTVEGILPGNVACIIECETDSRLRTLQGVRTMLKDFGGREGPSAYLFGKKGRTVFESKEGIDAEAVLDAALEAGATDVEDDENGVVIFSESTETKAVGEIMSKVLGLDIKTSEIVWVANEDTRVDLDTETAADELSGFIDELFEKEPTVSSVAMNVRQGPALNGDIWKDLAGRVGL